MGDWVVNKYYLPIIVKVKKWGKYKTLRISINPTIYDFPVLGAINDK